MLIELFSLDVTAEALRANIGSKSAISLQRGPVDPMSGRRGRPPSPDHSSSRKTRLDGLSYGTTIWTRHSFVLSQITRMTDGWTDRQSDRQNPLR